MKKRVALSTLAALMVLAIGGVVYADGAWKLERRPLPNGDLELRGEGWSTTRSSLNAINANMGAAHDVEQDAEVKVLLETFHAGGIEGRITYGQWGEDTYQGRVQYEMGKGKTYRDAVVAVLIEDGSTAEAAGKQVDIEAAYDAGDITWDQYRAIEKALAGNPALDVSDHIAKAKKEK